MTTKSNALNSLQEILQNNGHSITKQRRLIFEILNANDPLTIKEIYNLSQDLIDRASVYRIIDLFEKTNIVRRSNIGGRYKIELSDNFTAHHHHLTCMNCHKVTIINDPEIELLVDNIVAKHHFRPKDHQLEIQGYCDSCL